MTISIRTDFPGGNLRIDQIAADEVRIRPDLRDTTTDWFYWHFEAESPEDALVTFQFADRQSLGTRGPAVSEDGGMHWRYRPDTICTAPEGPNRFHYRFQAGKPVRFAFALPYLQHDWEVFAAQHRGDPDFREEVLCQSRQGRAVELIRIGAAAPERIPLLLCCRHHACESSASYVLEGFLAAALAPDETGRRFRQRVALCAVPFVDKDGVENGDQGKSRAPHDHNRDYIAHPIYPECAAIQRLADQERFRYVIDLHAPWLNGGLNEALFCVQPAPPEAQKRQQRLMHAMVRELPAETHFTMENLVPFGSWWNVGYGELIALAHYFKNRPECALAFTLEVSYANFGDTTITPELLRKTGEGLLRAFLATASGPEDILVPEEK